MVLATAVLAAADLDDALLPYQDAVAAAHRSGSILAFAEAKGSHLHAFLWRGELAEAEAEGREAVDAREAWGSPWSYLVAFLANALMEQGKLDDAAAALARAGSAPTSESGALVFLRESHARLSILRGDLAGGLDELFEVGRLFGAVGGRNPALFAWRSQAALALLRLAAEGPTNREIAQTLFVTPRTIEVHLTNVYRKLEIDSRSQLPAALSEPTRV